MLVAVLAAASVAPALASAPQAVGWGAATLVESDTTEPALQPHVALDESGSAVAVWHQVAGARASVWGNRLTPGAGWGVPTLLETDDAGDASFPDVAVDKGGNATAVWMQNVSVFSIFSSRFEPGRGWGRPVLIETDDAGHAFYPFVAADAAGNAIAAWSQFDGTRQNIWANRYTQAAGWGTATLLETDNAGSAFWPQVAIDAAGDAVAVWYQSDGTRTNIWASRYTAGAGWATAVLLENDDAGGAVDPQVALDPGGNATVVWSQSDGTRPSIWANRYTVGSGWGAPALIETDDAGWASRPSVGVDASGVARVVWSQSNFFRYSIWTNRFVPGAGWGTRALVETLDTGDAYYPRITVAPTGEAVAVWQQSDGARENIWANRFEPTLGWGAAQLLEGDNAGRALIPRVAGNARGDAVAVWYQTAGGIEHILANAYTAQDQTPPPLTLEGPAEGTLTNRSALWVSGRTEPGALASVNGVEAFVAANGSFGLTVALAPGPNALKVAARDASGNEATAWVNVTFEDPVPGIEARLHAAEGALAAAQADLAASRARLAEAEAEGNATQAELAAARADLASAEANVDLLESALNSTRADVALIGSELQNASVRLLVVEGEASALKGDQALAQARERELSAALQLTTAVATAGFALALGALAVIAAATRAKGREPGGKP